MDKLKFYYKHFVLLIAFIVSTQSIAQQTVQYSHYMLNPFLYNSAYAGMNNSLTLGVGYRKQWTSLIGTPENYYLTSHIPLAFINSGVGLQLEQDNIGFYKRSNLKAAYNYIFKFNKNHALSIGLNTSIFNARLDGSSLIAASGTYTNGIDHQDNYIPNAMISTMSFSLGGGIYYRYDNFEIGLGISDLNSPKADFEVSNLMNSKLISIPNYSLSTRTKIQYNPSLVLTPSFLLKTDFIKFQPEVSLLFEYNDNIIGGFSLRGYEKTTIDALVLLGGFKVNEALTIAYSYDWSIGGLKDYNDGSHELSLLYNLQTAIGIAVPPKVIFNPRYL